MGSQEVGSTMRNALSAINDYAFAFLLLSSIVFIYLLVICTAVNNYINLKYRSAAVSAYATLKREPNGNDDAKQPNPRPPNTH